MLISGAVILLHLLGFSKFIGNPNPCHPVDLDAPVERNEEVVSQRAAEIGKSVHDLEKETQQLVHLGWTSDVVNVHVDVWWVALEMKARSPEKFMDDVFLSRSMTMITKNVVMMQRIWINLVASEIVFSFCKVLFPRRLPHKD